MEAVAGKLTFEVNDRYYQMRPQKKK